MVKTIPYSTSVSPDIRDVSELEFAQKVSAVLSDPRGWRKYGYAFKRIPAASVASALRIRLETASSAEALCRMGGFSCWRPPSNEIIIHHGNWNGGSRSQLPLERYRNYVINHEVGHSLGLFHKGCPIKECALRGVYPCPASIMQQMTRGPGHVAPCEESDWPLDPAWNIDNPKKVPHKAILIAIIVITILIVLVLLFVRYSSKKASIELNFRGF